MLTCTTLASGSSGNAMLVSCGGTHVLVDAGVSARRITGGLAALGVAPEELSAILVTHDISESISMSDHVVVLSARPGRVKSIHDLTPLRGLSPMERREHPLFSKYFNAIWKELELSA